MAPKGTYPVPQSEGRSDAREGAQVLVSSIASSIEVRHSPDDKKDKKSKVGKQQKRVSRHSQGEERFGFGNDDAASKHPLIRGA